MKQKIFIHGLVALGLFALSGAFAFAQPAPGPVPAPASMYTNPVADQLSIDSIPCFLLALIDLIFIIATPIIVIFIIYAGFLFVTAQGNETKIVKARTVITWTLIGAGVLLASKGISLGIQDTLNSVGANGTVGPLCP